MGPVDWMLAIGEGSRGGMLSSANQKRCTFDNKQKLKQTFWCKSDILPKKRRELFSTMNQAATSFASGKINGVFYLFYLFTFM